jgi:hypothetical protein
MEELNEVLESASKRGRTMRWSNFLITISTNVIPHSIMERINITNWLRTVTGELFYDFDSINGTVIKPAGSQNNSYARFGPSHKIDGVKAQVTIEEGKKKGQMHAHVLFEVCHHFTDRNQFGLVGVHLNRLAIKEFMENRIPSFPTVDERKPKSIYVNCRLLTSKTDTSSKWLTLSYINKDLDAAGRNLKADRQKASTDEQELRRRFISDGEMLVDEDV